MTTVCRIRDIKSDEKKKGHQSIVHEFEGRVYVDKEKNMFKFDIVNEVEKVDS